MSVLTRVGGVWKNVPSTGLRVNVGGAWKSLTQGYVNVAGVWKPLFSDPVDLSYTANLHNGANQASYSFAATPLGVIDPNRAIAVAVSMSGQLAASVTVNGIALTLVGNQMSASNNKSANLFIGIIPNGNTGNVVVATSGAAAGSCGGAVYRLLNLQSLTATLVGKVVANGSSALLSTTVNKKKDGCTIAAMGMGTGSNPVYDMASQLDTADVNGAVVSAQLAGASLATWTGAVRNVRNTINAGGNTEGVLVAASFR